ncbi:MAG: CRTAC1 family protein, partial [Alphaproteobacteria bacterium]|nr:CRTAC1 family protein [Alphaproteobacteria bacterium]
MNPRVVGLFASAALLGCAPDVPWLTDIAAEAGLVFEHEAGATGAFRLPEIIGSGAALLDYDGDGDLDVYLIQGHPGARTSDRLFRNTLVESGRLGFLDVTAAAGLGRTAWGMGAAVGDYDNDGDADLYVTAFGSNVLYRNNGDGTFTDVTAEAGVDDPRWTTGAAFVDYDADGDLDLVVVAYVDFTEAGNKPCYEPAGQRDYCLPAEFRPLPARLFRNDGAGRFADVTVPAGLGAASGAGLGVIATDANGDGWLDLYVANDGTANHLWVNDGAGTFTERGLESGTAFDVAGRAEAGMGLASGDFDEDGDEDLFVTNLVGETNTLYVNDGRGAYEDRTPEWGLAAPSRPFTGFGTTWFDLDNDGRLDLFVANGAVSIDDRHRGATHPYQQRNSLLRLEAGVYRDVSLEAGPALALEEVSRGAAFGDLDNDGDIDVLVTNNNGPARLLRNDLPRRPHWLGLRLQGTVAARDAQGAAVRVIRPGGGVMLRRAHTDGSYLSASDPRVFVGLGVDGRVAGVEVEWRRGEREVFEGVS